MLRIMLCDDDSKDLYALKKLVEKYWETQKLPMPDICVTQSSGELMQKLQGGEIYDICILDILLGENDGISIGKAIRKVSDKSIIIYATGSPEFAFGAFGVYASGYLLKPVKATEFAECMEHVLRRITWKKELTVAVKSKDGVIHIDADKLMRVENVSRIMHFYMENGEVIESVYIRQSFEEQLKEFLQDVRFIQPHKSFLINAEYIKNMLSRDFVMTDGTLVPISRGNHTMVKKQYLEYLIKSEG